MKDAIRGIECQLEDSAINGLLFFLAKEPCEFFVPWYSAIYNNGMILPSDTKNFVVDSDDIAVMMNHTIWEMVLHLYPPGAQIAQIETYEDFVKSSCICCLIYYDCGFLDIYVKDPQLLERIREQLISLNATDMVTIRDSNDGRTHLTT